MVERLKSGLPLAPEAWEDILKTAQDAGLKQSNIDSILKSQ